MKFLTKSPQLASLCKRYIFFLQSISGYKRIALAFGVGSTSALAMPPFDFFPLLFIGFPTLIFLLRGSKGLGQAFGIGWSFAFGFLVFSLYWIAASMFVDIAYFWWAVPLAVAGLPALFALYYGMAAAVAKALGLEGVGGAITFGLVWFLADYARGHMFTGFPWNIVGYTWSGVLPILQSTSFFGIYGLCLATTVAASMPASLSDNSKRSYIAVMAAIVIFVAMTIAGEIRLERTVIGTVPDVRLRLVQPNIDQRLKWKANERATSFEDLLDLTSAPSSKPITHFIWPETASPYYLSEDPEHRREIASHIPSSSFVLTGVVRHDTDLDDITRYYNSFIAVDGEGRIVAGYDKTHLVPFGEFMPFRKYIPLRSLAASTVDFTPGQGPQSLRVLGLPTFSPLICYEAIFPGEVIDKDDRPHFMINITNDGWYGNTIGPYQHFAIVRIRAIEEGLPLIRAANTGISGVVDPTGRVLKRLGLGKKGFIDTDLPSALPETFYDKWGERPLWFLFLALCTPLIWKQKFDKNRKDME